MHDDNTDGIAFLCDVDGHILNVLHDSFGLPALQPGGNLLALFGPFSEAKAANLLSAVRNQEIVLDWELNLPLSGTVVTLRLAGGRKDDNLLIIGAATNEKIGHACSTLQGTEIEPVADLSKQIASYLAANRQQIELDAAAYDDLTSLYNELATAQRELAKRNVQLEQAEQRLREINARLEETVEQRTAELRQSKEDIEAILANSPTAVLLLNDEGRIERCNPAVYGLLGHGCEDFDEQTLPHLFHAVHQSTLDRAFRILRKSTQTSRFEAVIQRQNGTDVEVEVAIAGIYQDGRLRNMVCTLLDISTYKEIQRMKDALLATTAHELRTPLSTIQGFSEILATREVSPENQLRYSQLINEQAAKLASIVTDILDVVSIQSGQPLAISAEIIDLVSLINKTALPLIAASPLHNARIEEQAEPVHVRADAKRIAQVIRNLVSNAIKFSPEGGTIAIRHESDAEFVTTSVEDEGIGLTAEQQQSIFDAFYRVNISNTALEGVGLGLTVAKGIVEAHGGEIWAESEPGVGSTFTFTVPLADRG